MTYRKSEGVDGAMRRIAEQAKIMTTARETAEEILNVAKPLFVGRRCHPFKSGNLAGVYQITDVDIHPYSGDVFGYGRKIVRDGLGRQTWELGTIHLSRLLP